VNLIGTASPAGGCVADRGRALREDTRMAAAHSAAVRSAGSLRRGSVRRVPADVPIARVGIRVRNGRRCPPPFGVAFADGIAGRVLEEGTGACFNQGVRRPHQPHGGGGMNRRTSAWSICIAGVADHIGRGLELTRHPSVPAPMTRRRYAGALVDGFLVLALPSRQRRKPRGFLQNAAPDSTRHIS
jgi:hypothetical protein